MNSNCFLFSFTFFLLFYFVYILFSMKINTRFVGFSFFSREQMLRKNEIFNCKVHDPVFFFLCNSDFGFAFDCTSFHKINKSKHKVCTVHSHIIYTISSIVHVGKYLLNRVLLFFLFLVTTLFSLKKKNER